MREIANDNLQIVQAKGTVQEESGQVKPQTGVKWTRQRSAALNEIDPLGRKEHDDQATLGHITEAEVALVVIVEEAAALEVEVLGGVVVDAEKCIPAEVTFVRVLQVLVTSSNADRFDGSAAPHSKLRVSFRRNKCRRGVLTLREMRYCATTKEIPEQQIQLCTVIMK